MLYEKLEHPNLIKMNIAGGKMKVFRMVSNQIHYGSLKISREVLELEAIKT